MPTKVARAKWASNMVFISDGHYAAARKRFKPQSTLTTAITYMKTTTSDQLAARVEAYGVKGMKSTRWRRVFKDLAALDKWVEKTGAEVYGVRDYEG